MKYGLALAGAAVMAFTAVFAGDLTIENQSGKTITEMVFSDDDDNEFSVKNTIPDGENRKITVPQKYLADDDATFKFSDGSEHSSSPDDLEKCQKLIIRKNTGAPKCTFGRRTKYTKQPAGQIRLFTPAGWKKTGLYYRAPGGSWEKSKTVKPRRITYQVLPLSGKYDIKVTFESEKDFVITGKDVTNLSRISISYQKFIVTGIK